MYFICIYIRHRSSVCVYIYMLWVWLIELYISNHYYDLYCICSNIHIQHRCCVHLYIHLHAWLRDIFYNLYCVYNAWLTDVYSRLYYYDLYCIMYRCCMYMYIHMLRCLVDKDIYFISYYNLYCDSYNIYHIRDRYLCILATFIVNIVTIAR